jgi:phosphoglycerate kinase
MGGEKMNLLPKIQETNLKGKVVLIRVDHNVVKKGIIKDPYRIDASLETIKYVILKGGKPIIMSHIGRPRDKKTGKIEISEKTSVKPIVEYLKTKLNLEFIIPSIQPDENYGLKDLEVSDLIKALRLNKIDGIYLPNTRWFAGEEAGDESTIKFGKELSGLADIFVNDAFGSWQPHASTIEPTKYIPSYTGLLMQKEIENLSRVLNPKRPLLAVVAGSKFDTKIRPLTAILKMADHLVLGGVIYNAYLCAKYGFTIKGVSEGDIQSAKNFIKETKLYQDKILELPYIIESDILEEKTDGKFRIHDIRNLKQGCSLNYILDISPESFQLDKIKQVFFTANTIFVNAVMGFTPNFSEGTIALDLLINENKQASKLFGGGDTLQELKTLLPKIYKPALENDKFYFFTGGGTILKAIEQGSAAGLSPIHALLKKNQIKSKNREAFKK